MISRNFSMHEFFERVIERSYGYLEIIAAAEREGDSVEVLLRGKTRKQTVERGGRTYVEELGAFLFFMRFGMRPSSATDDEFQSYRRVCETLVEKGHFKPSILEMFS